MRTYTLLLLILLSATACVSTKQFQATTANYQATTDSLQMVIGQLSDTRDTLRQQLAFERGAKAALFTTQDKLQDRLDILQLEIDRLGNNADATRQDLNSQLQSKDATLAERQARLDAAAQLLATRQARLGTLHDSIVSDFVTQIMDGEQWRIRITNGQLRIDLGETHLFQRNSTSRLTDEGENLLLAIGERCLGYPEMQLQIIGHTDNRPNRREGLDNWQYTALRAVSVVKFLTNETDLGANRVLAAAQSEYAPRATNETDDGRAQNRRIEIRIAPRDADLERELRKILE